MTETCYNEESIKLAMRVYADKGFDCAELLNPRDDIDWLPVAQALCVRFFNRKNAFDVHRLMSSVIRYWKYEDQWLEEYEKEWLVMLEDSIECDWIGVFNTVFGRCDDGTACIIQLPMRKEWSIASNKPAYDDMACRCWRDEDAEVIRMVLDAGAQIRKMDSIKSDAVLCWCSAPVCDIIFEHMGWDYASMDYSTCKWAELIRTSGNLHTFEIVRQYAPDKLPLDAFKLNDLYKEQRYEVFRAVLALYDDGSVKNPKAKQFLLDLANRNDVEAVGLILKKMVFNKNAIKDVVANVSGAAENNEAGKLILQIFGSAPAAQPAKRSMTVCFKDAQIGAETADSEMIRALAPHASKVKPEKVVDLLERAAAYGDKKTIATIYEVLGKPEFLSSALCVAIRNGNEATARALLDEGASLLYPKTKSANLKKYTRDHLDEDEVFAKSLLSEWTIGQFFEFVAPEAHPDDLGYLPYHAKYPGEYCHKDKALSLLRTLFESNSLEKRDLGAVGYAILYIDADLGIRMIEQAVPEDERSAKLSQLIGTTLDHGEGTVIDFAYRYVTPEDLVARFSKVRGYMTQNPDSLARCVRHLPAGEVKPTEAMWKSLISGGHLDELGIVCGWTRCTPSDIDVAMTLASELEKPEAIAVLLEARKKRCEGPGVESIEL